MKKFNLFAVLLLMMSLMIGCSKKQEALLEEFYNLCREHRYSNNNLIDTFMDVCKNSVVYPVAFSKNTAEWSREKYGKLVGYAHAGEIIFINTPDKIFFEIKRHF